MKTLKFFLLILSCYFLSESTLLAQKAKFKNKVCSVQKTSLPVNYINPENRTYDILTKGAYSLNVDPHQKKVFGWTKDQENPKLKGVISIYGFSIGKPSKNSQKKEKKDKAGKVTKSWTEYSYSNNARGKGTLYIYGEENPFQYKKKRKAKSKSELKREAQEQAAKKDLQENPFLSSDDIAEAEESDIGADEGLSDETLELVKTVSVDQTRSVETGKYRSAGEAYKEYSKKLRPQLYDFKRNFHEGAYKSAISQLNHLYGYTPTNKRFYLKSMKSDKHPEFKKWNDACQATQTLFKAVKYNKSIAETQTKFDPIINYFGDMVTKSSNDKKAKRLNKAAFTNLMDILFYLDRHDDMISWAEKNLDSKFIDKIAKRNIEKAERQKAHLTFQKMETCHIESADEVKDDEIETDEAVEEAAEEGSNN